MKTTLPGALLLLTSPFIGWGLYRLTHHPVEARASTRPSPMPAPVLSARTESAAEREARWARETAAHEALMKRKQDGLDARWDKCVAAHGLPVPGFAALDDRERWGLMCVRPSAVIYIDDTAW